MTLYAVAGHTASKDARERACVPAIYVFGAASRAMRMQPQAQFRPPAHAWLQTRAL
jgi:hypothetical protein